MGAADQRGRPYQRIWAGDQAVELLPEIDDSLLADRRKRACRGTAVTGGRGARVVVATGMATELGGARGLWQHALWVGLTMAAVCLALLVGARAAGWPWQSMVFTTLALLQLGHALAVRSERESFFSLGAWSNPLLLGAVVGAVAVQLAILYVPVLQGLPAGAVGHRGPGAGPARCRLAASTAAFVAVELQKWVIRRRSRRSHHSPACWPFCVAPDASRLLLGG